MNQMKKLEDLAFNNTYVKLGEAYFSRVLPTPMVKPQLVAFNPDAAKLIGLDPSESTRPDFLEYFSGQCLFPGSDPVAMVYSGHQFGVRVPRLGDGRAILLGEVVGENEQGKPTTWDLQLKGSGQTPYSRFGDGRAVLRSSIREYLCGEAMHALGIPTTRTLCIVGSDEQVFREEVETRAMITRIAESHVRFGSFEYFFQRDSQNNSQNREVQRLADYVIREHFPEIEAAFEPGTERYGAWLTEVTMRTARLIAKWQAVGFSHGVMNTDNMSILALTLDYGPYGFMEEFDSAFVCNHSDENGRYAFLEQPGIGLWNLNVLAHSLSGIMSRDHLVAALKTYEPTFHDEYLNLFRAKLGLVQKHDGDAGLISELLGLMEQTHVDYTNFFRALGKLKIESDDANDKIFHDFFGLPRQDWRQWAELYRSRLRTEIMRDGSIKDQNAGQNTDQNSSRYSEFDAAREKRMNGANPKFVLRNHLAQRAIDAAVKYRDYTEIEKLLHVLRTPFSEHAGAESYALPPTGDDKNIQVSCSS